MDDTVKARIIKKWQDSGLLDGLTEMDKTNPILKVFKSIGEREVNELPIEPMERKIEMKVENKNLPINPLSIHPLSSAVLNNNGDDCVGLTKREYFTALAMQGILSRGSIGLSDETVAERAVRIADETLDELEKSTKD